MASVLGRAWSDWFGGTPRSGSSTSCFGWGSRDCHSTGGCPGRSGTDTDAIFLRAGGIPSGCALPIRYAHGETTDLRANQQGLCEILSDQPQTAQQGDAYQPFIPDYSADGMTLACPPVREMLDALVGLIPPVQAQTWPVVWLNLG